MFGEKVDISKEQRKEFKLAFFFFFLSERKERSDAKIRKKEGVSSSKL